MSRNIKTNDISLLNAHGFIGWHHGTGSWTGKHLLAWSVGRFFVYLSVILMFGIVFFALPSYAPPYKPVANPLKCPSVIDYHSKKGIHIRHIDCIEGIYAINEPYLRDIGKI